MPSREESHDFDRKPAPAFTEAARIAALAARKAKRKAPELFGVPDLFVVKVGELTFAWELRRFGGIVLQRGPESFGSAALARADGEKALTALCAAPDLPKFKKQGQLRADVTGT